MKKPAKDWVFFADNDLKAAEVIIQADYPLTNIIAFHCQQAVEKYLKAFLVEKNIPVIKTHDLIRLRLKQNPFLSGYNYRLRHFVDSYTNAE